MLQDNYYLLGFFYVINLSLIFHNFKYEPIKLIISKSLSLDLVTIIYFFFAIVVFGFRDYNTGNDTLGYVMFYEELDITNFEKTAIELDYLFVALMIVCKYFFYLSTRSFLIVISLIYSSLLFTLIKKVFEKNYQTVILLYLCSFFFIALGTNIIRSSIAIVIWLWGIYFIFDNKKIYGILLIIISIGFHFTGILVLLISILSLVKISFRLLIIVLIISLIISYNEINIFAFIPELDDVLRVTQKINSYSSNNDSNYKLGFRKEFVLLNLLFICWGIRFNNKNNELAVSYTRFFIYSSIVFFLCFNIPYSDRVGMQSWILIPFILILPYKETKIPITVKIITLITAITMISYVLISLNYS